MVSYNQIRKCILVITILLSSAGSISICLCGCAMVCWSQMAEMLSPSYLPYITQTPAPAAAPARGRKWLLCPLQIDPGYRLELHTKIFKV